MSHEEGVTASAASPEQVAEAADQQQLEEALRDVPKGALALAGLTVGLLVLAWLAMYVFVFLPRGMVG
jgi:amino acid transporter